MFLIFVVISAIAVALIKLGALSVWVAVLSMALKAMSFAALIGVIFLLARYRRQRRKDLEQ